MDKLSALLRGIAITLLAPLLLVLVVGVMLLAVPVTLVRDGIGGRRMLRAAQSFACTMCGATLGDDALELANEQWGAELKVMREDAERRGVRLRVVQPYHAVCPSCGERYTYFVGEQSFKPYREPDTRKESP